MVTRKLFLLFLGLLAIQRLIELRVSRKNEKWLMERGGQEFFPAQLRAMKVLHAAWMGSAALEVFALRRPFFLPLAGIAAIIFIVGQFLRYAAIHALGDHWTVKVITIPGVAPVEQGVYRYIRHPNYLGVALEIAAAPLLHSAYWTAAIFSLLNGLLLSRRIQTEEQVLTELNDYKPAFEGQARFIPSLGRPKIAPNRGQ